MDVKGIARSAGLFAAHCAAALMGPALAENQLMVPIMRQVTIAHGMLVEDIGSSVVAAVLGFTIFRLAIYRSWPRNEALWVWMTGLCWFAERALFPPDGRHVIFWELEANKSVLAVDMNSAIQWSVYTLPLLRTLFYSIGAWLSWQVAPRTPKASHSDTSGRTLH